MGLSDASVKKALSEAERPVQMLMNAPEKQITVTMTPRARIPKDHSSARVIKDIVEMESLAQMWTNAF